RADLGACAVLHSAPKRASEADAFSVLIAPILRLRRLALGAEVRDRGRRLLRPDRADLGACAVLHSAPKCATEADAFSVLIAPILAPAPSCTRRRSARLRPTPSPS
ncbi:hypothetical protein PR001_g27288, partial [Phytophthora rubi]